MRLIPTMTLLVAFAFFAVGCINPLPGSLPSTTSDPAALELLAASAEAHGGDKRFAEVSAINVSYDGEWLNNVWKLQPMLVDRDYRKSSVERIEYGRGWPVVTQTHTGPDAGKKEVRWPADKPQDETLDGGASVVYDGQRIEDPAERVRQEEASAMVAEAYRMFLTGPFYFTQRQGVGQTTDGMTAVMSKPTTVLGAECDQVLVELRPGFGTSKVDRVEVAIDRETKYVRRVRFSLDGFRKTRGATADVEFDNFVERDGLIFPTEYLEIVVHPINREVHEWYVTDLSVESQSTAE
ncbi:MAG: hypothetical protein AAF593_05080 [Planctomycetota bacterium]